MARALAIQTYGIDVTFTESKSLWYRSCPVCVTVNLRAAKEIGLTVPPEVLLQANKVIR
jgi:hypothetical protein